MLRHHAWRAVLVGATLTASAAFGSGAASAAGAQSDVVACHADGYVCLTTNDLFEPTVSVAEGEDYAFFRATEVTSMSNDTAMTYCVDAEYGFKLSPGQSIEVTHTVTALTAAPDGNCLS
ncbi:hypothetical protein [Streptomyces sp. KL116D]|uniref:hypothetical protein n=1 Tax=Streptomyces sp. KL116D TaxID=3045152 RepID=UPI0035563019